ncbi:MAG: DNA repair protein RecN [Muribaculaceae bacterium]|nr:DNA repair protein RecN [Muribaculaceae bacterium]
MLKTLHISNYALIDVIDIEFTDGFNVLTGETGAGKSIILGALLLLLGSRADSKVVRDKSKKSIIEALFVGIHSDVAETLKNEDIDSTGDEILLRREVDASSGRSRAFINDSQVNLDILRTVASHLVDIHSQHQNQLLAQPDYQLLVIDAMSDFGTLKSDYTAAYADYRRALRLFHTKRREVEKAKADEDYIRHQFEQINSLRLEEGEQKRLEEKRDMLANAADISASLTSMLQSLSEGEENALSLIEKASQAAPGMSIIDNDRIAERLESASIELQDIRDTLEEYSEKLAANPDELQAVEDRLNDIYSLQRRHNVNSVEALIELRERFYASLRTIESGDDDLAELETDARRKKSAAVKLAKEISERRQVGAERFVKLLIDRARPLSMKNLQAEVKMSVAQLSATGIDAVEMVVSFNKNQELMTIGSTASGGEISRLMLVVKSIVADRMDLPTVIFDEIDTGVSGEVANRMGALMRQISENIQVLAITHLPQVAALGDSHYKVYKHDDEIATLTNIVRLDAAGREEEIAVMLSGESVDAAARQNAKSLLKNRK